ncbi:preprotein translocase subunit SecE [Thiomicrorhabdus indica]|uniref:preprotein translocase subunit SecE n=1 Tax=Thiomicrorhabdus indica TaxID=2267253 RepID=UPI00102D6A93|nr:preprotein translocase subunit SecE [Thiomicrorhabdus indica]
MSKEVESSKGNSLDTIKLLASIGVLVATLIGYYTYDQAHAVVRVLGLVAGVLVSLFILYQTAKGKSWFQYLNLAKREVRQVVWPTRPETVQMTLIVFVVVILMGIFLWLIDMFFLWAVKLLTGQG